MAQQTVTESAQRRAAGARQQTGARVNGFFLRVDSCKLRAQGVPAGPGQDDGHVIPGPGLYAVWAVAVAAFYACWATQPWPIAQTTWSFTVQPVALWAGSVVFILALFMLIGWQYNRSWKGVFINERYLVSASRLQAVVWTAVLLGTALSMFLLRMGAGEAAPLAFALPEEAIGLAGISVAGLAGAAGVSRIRKGRIPTPHEILERGQAAATTFQSQYAKDLSGRARALTATAATGTEVVEELTRSLKPLPPEIRDQILPPATRAKLDRLSPDAVASLLEGQLQNPKALARGGRPRLSDAGALVGQTSPQITSITEAADGVIAGAVDGTIQLAQQESEELGTQLLRATSIAAFKNDSHGAMFANRAPCEARWTDLIQGDELANASSLDFGKVQMLGFTALVLGAYVAVLWRSFSGDPCAVACPAALPAISAGLVQLLGVSHLGYLGGKVAGPTRTQ